MNFMSVVTVLPDFTKRRSLDVAPNSTPCWCSTIIGSFSTMLHLSCVQDEGLSKEQLALRTLRDDVRDNVMLHALVSRCKTLDQVRNVFAFAPLLLIIISSVEFFVSVSVS